MSRPETGKMKLRMFTKKWSLRICKIIRKSLQCPIEKKFKKTLKLMKIIYDDGILTVWIGLCVTAKCIIKVQWNIIEWNDHISIGEKDLTKLYNGNFASFWFHKDTRICNNYNKSVVISEQFRASFANTLCLLIIAGSLN